MAKRNRIAAKDLYNYTKCPHRVYLDANGNPEEKGEVSSFTQLLWEKGLQTERDYLDTLGEYEVMDLNGYSFDEALKKTLQGMQSGQELIYQGCLQAGDNLGRPDLLFKRTDNSSKFGAYYYEPLDIKAGRGWDEREGQRTKFKEHYAFQMIFYRRLLEDIQGYIPQQGRIINVAKEVEEFDPGNFEAKYQTAFESVKKLVQGEATSEPVLGGTCTQCEWFNHCRKWVKKHLDPSAIFFIGKVKFSLKKAGLKTINDIAKMDVQKYLKGEHKIPRVGEKSLSRMKERARVVLSGKPVLRPGYSFPDVKNEIYFDIEDDPTRGITYLFGLLTKQAGLGMKYDCFVAERPEDEEATIKDFWDFIEQTDDAVYYVYSPKERSSLKHLMERYRLDEQVFNKYLSQEFDLYAMLVEYSDWPTFSYGIKHIANQIGFRWRDADPSGVNSIAWYNDYLENVNDKSKLQRILDYNEDDCRAMVALKDYFERKALKSN